MQKDQEEIVWYALRATYGRGLMAQKILDADRVESFIPQHYQIGTAKNGHKERRLVPFLKDLIFVHTSAATMKEEKKKIPYLLYITQKKDLKNKPILVPDQQMQQFMQVIATFNEQLVLLKPDEIDLKQGTRVKVHGGPFDKQEGLFVRVKGIRNKRVVIAIDGVAAVALATINPDLIELIQE